MSDLIKQCDECRLNECINCEHSWADIQEIKKQLAEKDKEIERLNDRLDKYISGRLKSMIAEKDAQIEELKDKLKRTEKAMHEEVKEHLEYYNADQKQLRKQVCDEIRGKLKTQIIPTAGSWLSYYDITETNDLLDQIEGDANGK